jgi:hemolysin activation/secretion protein
VIRSSELQDDLDWLNENPFHTTDLVYHPGQTLGATDLELQTKDRFPARFYLGYDDTGNAETGFDRYEAGVNWGDAFGLGQQLNYQYSTSGNGDSLRAHAGSYVIQLPWHNTVTYWHYRSQLSDQWTLWCAAAHDSRWGGPHYLQGDDLGRV